MNKREEVIRKLEECLPPRYMRNEDIPLDIQMMNDEYVANRVDEALIKEALELLKAQEPRVMAQEELINKIGEPVYFESHGTYMGKDGFWILPALFTPSGRMRYVHPLSSNYSELGLHDYGKAWRCWTTQPTDEQRKAVKWDG